MMNRLPEEINNTIPDELVPAVEALDKSLDDAHFRCGKVTEVFCYGLLHPGENLEDAEELKLALSQLKAFVGPVATETFHQYLKMNTAPAFFHAMHQLYIAGVTAQAIRVFQDLLEIGRTHESRLGRPHIQWAHDLTLEMAKAYEYRAKLWIRSVCDPPAHDIDFHSDDVDDIVLGRTWCAPMLVVMRPSRYMPFDPEHVWDRTDRETTKSWMKSFCEMFTIHMKLHIGRLAGQKAVEFAKQPWPATEQKEESVKAKNTAQSDSASGLPTKVKVKLEYRRQKTAERNKEIRSEFRKLEKRKPGMSMVWYSRQLSGLEIAGKLDAETIRKIIRG
jgi:hypothetical protein